MDHQKRRRNLRKKHGKRGDESQGGQLGHETEYLVDISLIGVPRKKKEAGVNSIDAGISPSPVDTAAVCFHFWPHMFSIASE